MLRYTVGLYTFTFLDVIEIRWDHRAPGRRLGICANSEARLVYEVLMKEDEAQKGGTERMQHDYFSSDRAQIR